MSKQSPSADVSLNNLSEDFRNISNTDHCDFVADTNTELDLDTIHIEQLDCPFTFKDISKTIWSIQRYKSSDLSNTVADSFIATNKFIDPQLVSMLNTLFDTGTYPELWCIGVIVPMPTKGPC